MHLPLGYFHEVLSPLKKIFFYEQKDPRFRKEEPH